MREDVFEENLKLEVGSFVYIKTYKTYGTVTKIGKDKSDVNVGSISMKIDNDDLVVTKQENNKEEAKSSFNKNKEVKIEVS